MREIRLFIVAAVFILVFSASANAQGTVSYGFLEVVDFADKPVANANVRVEGSCGVAGEHKTNQRGQLSKGLPIGGGDCQTYNFTISKNGYYDFAARCFGIIGYRPTRFKIELLKIPQTTAERKAIGDEQLKREFFEAAADGDDETVRKLLKAGLKPDLTTAALRGIQIEKNRRIFDFALSSGDSETVKAFLSAGVDVRGFPNALETYLFAFPSTRRFPNYQTQKAEIIASYEDGARGLIEAGANVNYLGSPRVTTLMLAAQKEYVRIVKLLIEKGVPVNATDDYGRTALMYALMAGNLRLETASLLLDAGANPNIINEGDGYQLNCRTALILAARDNDLPMVKLLIERGANVNLACEDNSTALSYAKQSQDIFGRKQEIIKLLETAGAR